MTYPVGLEVTSPPRDDILVIEAVSEWRTVDGMKPCYIVRARDYGKHTYLGHSVDVSVRIVGYDDLEPACEHWPCADHAEFGAQACGWCGRGDAA